MGRFRLSITRMEQCRLISTMHRVQSQPSDKLKTKLSSFRVRPTTWRAQVETISRQVYARTIVSEWQITLLVPLAETSMLTIMYKTRNKTLHLASHQDRKLEVWNKSRTTANRSYLCFRTPRGMQTYSCRKTKSQVIKFKRWINMRIIESIRARGKDRERWAVQR